MRLNFSLFVMLPTIKYKQAGVSLLEFVIGLALLAIILLGVTLFAVNQNRQLDPVFQFRAVSLAEALAEQIWSVKYDTNNVPDLQTRCGVTTGAAQCDNTPQASTTNIKDFSVLDDFQKWCDVAIEGETLATELGLPAANLYSRFKVNTCVESPLKPLPTGYDKTDPDLFIKKITMIISIDNSSTLSFDLHRYNIR